MTVLCLSVHQGYHILAMALFLPALLAEPELLALSLGIAAAALIAAEVLRVGGCPWIGPCIHSFMTAFIDSRDQGLLLISHFSLLVGMAAPLWLALPAVKPLAGLSAHLSGMRHQHVGMSDDQPSTAGSGDEMFSSLLHAGVLEPRSLVGGSTSGQTVHQPWSVPAFAYAGIIILGVADSAASAVGRRFGRHKILQTHKSLEGTMGGIVFTILGWAVLAVVLNCIAGASMWRLEAGVAGVSWTTVLVAVMGSCLLEAVTTQLDNIFLPLHHCALLAM